MIETEALVGLFGMGMAYVFHRYLRNKDWGKHTEMVSVCEISDSRPLTRHTVMAVYNVNKKWKDGSKQLPYIDITIDEQRKRVDFWTEGQRVVEVSNPGPDSTTRGIIAIGTGILFAASTGFIAHSAYDTYLMYSHIFAK